MGSIIYNNGILFDERELGTLSLNGDALATAIYDSLIEAFPFITTFGSHEDYDDRGPWLEIFGFASERLGTSVSFDDFTGKASWIREGRDFRSTLRDALYGVALPNLDLVVQEDHAAILALRAGLERSACDRIAAGSYDEATRLLETLSQMGEHSLPGILRGEPAETDSDGLFDMRNHCKGPGTRIFAEIGFDWGQ